jgi:hypothetical protein
MLAVAHSIRSVLYLGIVIWYLGLSERPRAFYQGTGAQHADGAGLVPNAD